MGWTMTPKRTTHTNLTFQDDGLPVSSYFRVCLSGSLDDSQPGFYMMRETHDTLADAHGCALLTHQYERL
jgi:hypothetical protein